MILGEVVEMQKDIEDLRQDLYRLVREFGLENEKVLIASKKLDNILNDYQSKIKNVQKNQVI